MKHSDALSAVDEAHVSGARVAADGGSLRPAANLATHLSVLSRRSTVPWIADPALGECRPTLPARLADGKSADAHSR
jgi:hypothetical protein